MKKPEFQIFTKKAEIVYNEMVKLAINEISYSVAGDLEDKHIFELKIFNKYFKWPKIELSQDGINVTHATQELSVFEGNKLIGNGFTYSLSRETVDILTVVYKIPFKGDVKALECSVNYPARNETIHINNSGFIEYILFSQKTVIEEKDRFKQNRDNLISLINSNQKQIDDFFESKKELFQHQISLAIDGVIEKISKHKSDNDLLL